MIYLITGVPGSGKTLYAVSTLVKKLAAEKIKRKDGTEIKRRVVIDGIPDLLIPHEQMAPMVEDEKGNFTSDGDSLLNWYDWCQAGDVIVCDEVQRFWRPRGLGTKPPEMIKRLETHRHKGVDFVIITQNPMLIDQNVRRLVGRHQHVRRLFGMARALIYDWDGCSVDVHRTKTASSSLWSYPKSAFKLYKSSELHTKQKQKIPIWLLVPVLAMIGAVIVGPKAFGTMAGAMSGRGVSSVHDKPAETAKQAEPTHEAQRAVAVLPAASAASAPSGTAEQVVSGKDAPAVPVLAGCVVFHGDCSCRDQFGGRFEAEDKVCQAKTDFGPVKASGRRPPPVPPLLAALDLPTPSTYAAQDAEAMEWIAKHRPPLH